MTIKPVSPGIPARDVAPCEGDQPGPGQLEVGFQYSLF